MKKLLYFTIVSLWLAACTSPAKEDKKEDPAAQKAMELKANFEKNLASLKSSIAAFEKKDIEGWAATVADSAIWISPAYGDTVQTKAHWKASLKAYLDNWNNLHLSNGQFYEGVDSVTHMMDGSVRYYGRWDGVHTSGKATHLNFYGAYDFNKDHKVTWGAEYFDLGGLMNAVAPKK